MFSHIYHYDLIHFDTPVPFLHLINHHISIDHMFLVHIVIYHWMIYYKYHLISFNTKSYSSWVWESKVQHKVKIFGWRMLQNKLPMREQLSRRGFIVGLENCRSVLCNEEIKSIEHIFLSCIMTR